MEKKLEEQANWLFQPVASKGQHQLDQEKIAPSSTANLRRELAWFRVTTSRFFPNFSFHRMLAEATHCQVVEDMAVRLP